MNIGKCSKEIEGEISTGESSAGATKRKGRDSSRYKVQYCQEWEEFKWLLPKVEKGVVVGMFCKMCKRHKCTAKYNHSTVWSEVP